MAAVDVGMRNNPPINDDLDDPFNYDVDEDIYKDVDTRMDLAPKPDQPLSGGQNHLDDTLGLGQEIKVRKARQPVPKLDEQRLLSQAGVPKLRKLTKERLRFKGKGHEFSDVARLLNLYQLWLDDLYPRAKFADGLAMIEKLGHTKQMQSMRKDWIREGRANMTSNVDDENQGSKTSTKLSKEDASNRENDRSAAAQKPSEANPEEGNGNHAESRGSKMQPSNGKGTNAESLFVSDDEQDVHEDFDDDLDAIMAEDDARQVASTAQVKGTKGTAPKQDDFADEEEAMRDMEGFW